MPPAVGVPSVEDMIALHAQTHVVAPRLDVDLSAIAHNTRTIATYSNLMAVVKADGFGHGAADVARTALANGATSLGVATIDEALALHAALASDPPSRGTISRVPILAWLTSPSADFESAIRAGIHLAIPSTDHLAAIAAARRHTPRDAARPPARRHGHGAGWRTSRALARPRRSRPPSRTTGRHRRRGAHVAPRERGRAGASGDHCRHRRVPGSGDRRPIGRPPTEHPPPRCHRRRDHRARHPLRPVPDRRRPLRDRPPRPWSARGPHPYGPRHHRP